MKCSVDDCQNETNQRCSVCEKPVCWEHGRVPLTDSLFTVPLMGANVHEPVCPHCLDTLQEELRMARRKEVSDE